MSAATTKLPDARDKQLHAIAAFYATTKAGAIERFIRSEIAAGHIPDVLPGFTAEAQGKSVVITIEDQRLPAMAPNGATALAELIERLATDRGRKAGYDIPLGAGRRLDIARKGTGILIRIVGADGKAGEMSTLTFSMAADFCRSIHAAALSARYEA